jgi:hypothetical protein
MADTTEGRVPLFGPGAEHTFIPTVSRIETRLSQADLRSAVLVTLVTPAFTIIWTRSARGRNASVASGSSIITTRAAVVEGAASGSEALAAEDPISQTNKTMVLRKPVKIVFRDGWVA